MTTIDSILSRIKKSGRIRFFQGYYGNQWVEVKSGWLLAKKTRFELTADEVYALKSALKQTRGSLRAGATEAR